MEKYLKSKTIWFNTTGIPLIMVLLSYAQDNLVLVKDNLGASYGVVAFLIGIIGVYLRKVTTESLENK